MKRIALTTAFLLMVALVAAAHADRGSIPFDPYVQIFEPSQRAIIGWNGEEEVMILSTDLSASQPTTILEVLPLPSEPQVRESNVQVFADLTQIINDHLNYMVLREDSRGQGAGAAPAPAAEVTFHERIGAHDITVFKVLDQEGFVAWVEDYLREQGATNLTVPDALNAVVAEYLADGFDWFVFDVVSLTDETKTHQAIEYRFATDYLYYPLRITRTETGWTSVDLIVLTPDPLTDFPGYPKDEVNLMHDLITVNNAELEAVTNEFEGLFAPDADLTLRIWQITGDLPSFTEDLLAR